MQTTASPDSAGETLRLRMETVLRDFQYPHPAATDFIRHMDQSRGCQRHVMLCTRSVAGVGCMPPPAQEATFHSIMETLEKALESEPCWLRIKSAIADNWRAFSIPPSDCQSKARAIINACSEPAGRFTASCRPPEAANTMQAEALDAIQEANHHIVSALAGSFVQYSLTSHEFRPEYSSLIRARLQTRLQAIRYLDQNCAFALHATSRWKDVNHDNHTMAQLMLWGNQVNTAAYQIQDEGNDRIIAFIMARRRLSKVTEQLVTRQSHHDAAARARNCETAAYWLEVSQNLMPTNSYTKAIYGIDGPPKFSSAPDR